MPKSAHPPARHHQCRLNQSLARRRHGQHLPVVGISTAAAGPQNGAATITLTSDGQGTSGLGLTTLAVQTVNVTGTASGSRRPRLSPPPLLTLHHPRRRRSQAGACHRKFRHRRWLLREPRCRLLRRQWQRHYQRLHQSARSRRHQCSTLIVGVNTLVAGSISGTATVAFLSDGAGTSGLVRQPFPASLLQSPARLITLPRLTSLCSAATASSPDRTR